MTHEYLLTKVSDSESITIVMTLTVALRDSGRAVVLVFRARARAESAITSDCELAIIDPDSEPESQ